MEIDKLFETHTVSELIAQRKTYGETISASQTELRKLVADKYRDLLHVADNIIEMNSVVSQSTAKLSQLAFSKANYGSNYTRNLEKFTHDTHLMKIDDIKSKSISKVMNNIIHDLNYMILNIQNDSHDFVKLGKHIFIIDNILTNKSLSPVKRFYDLKLNFIKLIENKLISIENDFDHDIYTNLIIGYILATSSAPNDAIIWSMDIRLNHLESQLNHWSLNKLLGYCYSTLQMSSIGNNKFQLALSRHINASSSWVSQSGVSKWVKWFSVEDYQLHFNDNLTSHFKLDQAYIDDFDNSINMYIKLHYDQQFQSGDTVDSTSVDGVNCSIKYLTSLRQFTSLVTLQKDKTAEDDCLSYIVDCLTKHLNEYIELNIRHLNKSCNIIIEHFDDDEYIDNITTQSGINLFNEFTLNEIIKSFDNQIEEKRNENQVNIEEGIISHLDQVKSLAKSITRPVISIDDKDDDEFWEKISTQLNDIVISTVSFTNDKLKNSFELFISKIQFKLNTKDKLYDNAQWLYLIREVLKFESNFNIDHFQSKLSELNLATELEKIDTNDDIHQCVMNLFQKVFNALFAKYSTQISANDLSLCSFGVSIEKILLDMVDYLKCPNSKEDFGDVFTDSIADEIQDDFIDKMCYYLTDANSDSGITLFSNLVFLECLLSNESHKHSDEILKSITDHKDEFENQKKLVKDHYSNQRILFWPFGNNQS